MKVTKRNLGVLGAFLLPGLVVYLWWVLYPVIQSFWLSLFKWTSLSSNRFAGFGNYTEVFSSSLFWKSLVNSLIFMVGSTLLQVVIGFFLGYFVYLQMRGYRAFKLLYFIPTILPSVAVGFIWSHIYSPTIGLVKPIMRLLGFMEYSTPLATPIAALAAIIITQVWASAGVQVILFNSGFMNMPGDVIESAALDGAKGLRMIWHMVIPLSWETVKMVIILQTIGALRAFDIIYVMTGGGPNHATEVLPMHLFVSAFQNFNLGYGNVVAVVIFLLSMVLTVIMRRLMAKDSLN